jgi:hypothetical protein
MASDFIFYLMYIPIVFHTAVGVIDLFRMLESLPGKSGLGNMVLSILMFMVYTVYAFTYHLAKVEYNAKFGNYMSRCRFSDTGLKLILLAGLALFLDHFGYADNPDLHLLAMGSVGGFLSFRFFFFIQFYRPLINFMEVVKGLVLFETALLCTLYETSEDGIYIPLVFAILFPVSTGALLFTHK